MAHSRFTPAEAFILGAAFYAHDLGMALAATPEGLARLRTSSEYAAKKQEFEHAGSVSPDSVDLLALRSAARELHAKMVPEFLSAPFPGLDQYLIENSELRRLWATHIAEIAASHHWSLADLHNRLGRRIVPTDEHGSIDLAFIACALRLIDYAHVNHERAPHLERALRSEISPDSLLHWKAQEYITGPDRRDDWLVYGSVSPLPDVDAWWLFYDIAHGLDLEIRAIRDYVDERSSSKNRLSLRGVRGVDSAVSFAQLVRLGGGVSPIDIRVQPDSMDRLVDLLGGKALYGSDELAPVRELLQNARDAIALRQSLPETDNSVFPPGLIQVSLSTQGTNTLFSVSDNGVGMTRSVITKHLIGIASDYWHSAEFYRDYGRALEKGFKPIGRFGIGFLSVFMLGNDITVETETSGTRHVLHLRSVGRRGELREIPPTGNRGTKVIIQLHPQAVPRFTRLDALVRARAPMLEIPILVKSPDNTGTHTIRIDPGWWKGLSDEEMQRFLDSWSLEAWNGGTFADAKTRERSAYDHRHYLYHPSSLFSGKYDLIDWPGQKPRVLNDDRHIVSTACSGGGVLRCSRGIAVDVFLPATDLSGIVEVGDIELCASRSGTSHQHQHLLEPHRPFCDLPFANDDESAREFLSNLCATMKPEIISKLDEIEQYGMLPARQVFLRKMATLYGSDIFTQLNLRWIPTVQHPGDTVHCSRRDVLDLLASKNSVLCGVGLTPRMACHLLATHILGEALNDTLMLPIATADFEVGYARRQELEVEYKDRRTRGVLSELCEQISVQPDDLIFLQAILAIVAEAWAIAPATLKEQEWILDFKSPFIVSLLRRPD